MAVYFELDNLPDLSGSVVTIGTFDGVHHGHQEILKEVASYAWEHGSESVVITFHPHPRKLLFPDQPIRLITPLDEKIRLIEQTGIRHIVVVPFTKAFSELTAAQYIENFLVRLFRPTCIIIGYDHHFGFDRGGDIALLRSQELEWNYKVIEIPPQVIDEATVSSTKIRRALQEGRVADAASMLDRHYSIRATVIAGKQLGRTIGYPTANLQPVDPEQIVPANGIYAVRIRIGDETLGGMMSIGFNPTVSDGSVLHLEVNIFNFSRELYGQEIEIFFVAWLRHEEKFATLEALQRQLAEDEQAARNCLSMSS